ncbi:MAG: T9SS type A sorting domain-containing protein, partial [Alistipes sp.]|nr:T9SS type A sorting domain-containing protein [Alistipes sp.]
ALYRTGENDGGSAYNSGKETIPAKLRAGTKSQDLKSLYCYPLNSDAASFGTLDLKNGYANSMYAASVCFEDDAYWNTLKVDITNKSLRIGLITSTSKYDSWCCFDNFRLEYLGGDPATATSVLEATEPSVDIYSIDGVLLKANVLQDAAEGLSRGIYILRNGNNVSKVVVR